VRHAHGTRCCRAGRDETKRNETERVARGDGKKKKKRATRTQGWSIDRKNEWKMGNSSLSVFLGDDEKKEKTLLALSIITALALSLFLSSKTPGR
jgi:hypothetical protein